MAVQSAIPVRRAVRGRLVRLDVSELRVHLVRVLAPVVSIVPELQPAEHPSELVPTLQEVEGVAPIT